MQQQRYTFKYILRETIQCVLLFILTGVLPTFLTFTIVPTVAKWIKPTSVRRYCYTEECRLEKDRMNQAKLSESFWEIQGSNETHCIANLTKWKDRREEVKDYITGEVMYFVRDNDFQCLLERYYHKDDQLSDMTSKMNELHFRVEQLNVKEQQLLKDISEFEDQIKLLEEKKMKLESTLKEVTDQKQKLLQEKDKLWNENEVLKQENEELTVRLDVMEQTHEKDLEKMKMMEKAEVERKQFYDRESDEYERRLMEDEEIYDQLMERYVVQERRVHQCEELLNPELFMKMQEMNALNPDYYETVVQVILDLLVDVARSADESDCMLKCVKQN